MFDGLLRAHTAADQRNVLCYDLSHLSLQPLNAPILSAGDLNKQTGTDGAFHFASGMGPQTTQSQENHKLRCSDISFPSCRVAVSQKLNNTIGRSHCPPHRRTIRLELLIPQRDIIKRKYFTGDLGCNRVCRQFTRDQTLFLGHIQKGLVGLCLHRTIIY